MYPHKITKLPKLFKTFHYQGQFFFFFPFSICLISQSPVLLLVDKLPALSLEHILSLSSAFAYAVPSFFLEYSSFSWPVPSSRLPPAHAAQSLPVGLGVNSDFSVRGAPPD